jgi:pyridoxine 5-phosphate synthase
MDPEPAQMAAVRAVGADRVELYTESWASAFGTPREQAVLAGFVATARAALDAGLGLNAGHDLSRSNLTPFLRAVPGIAEVSIGHALISDALELGYDASVKAYLACIARAGLGS